MCQAVALFVLDGHVDAGQWQTNAAAEGRLRDRVVGANGTGFTHAPALNHGAAGGSLPSTCCTFRRSHTPCLCEAQVRKINRFEHGVLQQCVEQSVHARQQVEGSCFESFNELAKVTRVGNQGEVRALANGQEAKCQCKDVIQRQCRNAVDFAQVRHARECWRKPCFCLQNSRHNVAVCEHGALGQACGATGVL